MSPAALAAQLAADAAAGTLPRAIIVVHLYGQSADMAALGALAARYGVPVVEDAAESLGARYDGRPSGAHGTLAAYSFNGNKIITTSGGGALVGDDPALIARARHLATQGRDDALHYQHADIAYNYRLSNVLAGIGCGQLELLADRVAARRAIHARYRQGLADVPGIAFQEEAQGGEGNRWLTAITLHPDHIPIHPYQVIRGLQSAGIEARPGWKPMHMQPLCAGLAYRTHAPDEDVSARLFLQSLCLPSGSALAPAAQDRVIARLRHLIGA
jgi:pyridoxal phosphate-dependent aminotransferase EpsN